MQRKNKVTLPKHFKNKKEHQKALLKFCAPKPNKKMFGLFPVRLGIYNMVYNKRENKFRWWLKNKVGEPPVLFNENISVHASENLRVYMFNLGYLDAIVNPSFSFKNRNAKTLYTVIPKKQYHIISYTIPLDTNTLYHYINEIQNKTLIKPKDPLDFNILEDERERITAHLRNNGYYNFRKDYINFELDTNQKALSSTVRLKIIPTVNDKWHIQSKIEKVNIFVDEDLKGSNKKNIDSVDFLGYTFIFSKRKYKEKMLSRCIFFEENDMFIVNDYQKTLTKFAGIPSIKFADIQFKERIQNDTSYLISNVYLTSAKKQAISFDIQANHNFNGFSGTSIGFSYQNRNLSKAADMLELKLSTGVEFNIAGNRTSVLNNAEVLVEANYYLNKFLLPFKVKKYSKNSTIRTKFSAAYNFERRIPYYSIHSTSFNFGYEWVKKLRMAHSFNPISFNLMIIPKKEPAFIDKLEQIPSLKTSFQEQIILGMNYTFNYNNKNGINDKSFFSFKGSASTAGNFLHGIVALTKYAKKHTRPYKIFNTEYSQFIRLEGTIVHNWHFAKHASLVSRFNIGAIVPYGNSTVAPYFQQFYVGGANSIRSYRLRALGPGTYVDSINRNDPNFFYDQAGDFKLEANTELRFDIFKWFKGAFFIDAGNVWLLRRDPDRIGGKIAKNNFFNALALGGGFGLRLDFDYFIVRADFALPMIDPTYSNDKRYPFKSFKFGFGRNSWFREFSIFHIAIGYPF